MYSFDDGGGRSLTLRPEGTAPVCRAYVEHGMHKLPAPVRLYYLSSFFRAERPQAGRYRQFWQLGIEALGSEDPAVDAETIVLLATLLERLGVEGVRLRLSSLGEPDTRAAYREELGDYLRAHADALAPAVRERIELNPLRAFDSDDPATREVMAGAPRLLDRLERRRRRALRGGPRAARPRRGRPRDRRRRSCAGSTTTRERVFEFTSDALGAQSGVGGGGRYDGLSSMLGGPPTPGIGWAAGDRADPDGVAGSGRAAARALDLFVAHERRPRRRVRRRWPTRARAGLAAQMELAGRSLKGQLKQAERLGARFVADRRGRRGAPARPARGHRGDGRRGTPSSIAWWRA